MTYPFVAAVLLPTANTDLVVPEGSMNRLLWIGMTAGLMGLLVPTLTLRRTPRRPPATQPLATEPPATT